MVPCASATPALPAEQLHDRAGLQPWCLRPTLPLSVHPDGEKRPGEYFPVFEDEKGTYILNSKDMCTIDHLRDLMDAGIDCIKIEGRAKSAYYAAIVAGAYRHCIDDACRRKAGRPRLAG